MDIIGSILYHLLLSVGGVLAYLIVKVLSVSEENGKENLLLQNLSKQVLNDNTYLFSPNWFFRNQNKLLVFVNTFIGRRFFRINGDRSSVGNRKIVEIAPNYIRWQNKDNSYSVEFRTHNKFTKRLYYQLYPVWYLLHIWDTLLDRKSVV